MKKIIFVTIFILTFFAFAFGQNSNCPAISVTGPAAAVLPGETMMFATNIEENGSDLSKLKYQWSVDKGTIVEGQGKPIISVSTEELFDTAVTATVEIKGLSENCNKSFYKSGTVGSYGDPMVIDEFGKLSGNDEKARLYMLVLELRKKPEFNAYIIVYYPQKLGKKSYENRVARIRNFLIRDNKIPSDRVKIIPGGDELEERTIIYFLPDDAESPTP